MDSHHQGLAYKSNLFKLQWIKSSPKRKNICKYLIPKYCQKSIGVETLRDQQPSIEDENINCETLKSRYLTQRSTYEQVPYKDKGFQSTRHTPKKTTKNRWLNRSVYAPKKVEVWSFPEPPRQSMDIDNAVVSRSLNRTQNKNYAMITMDGGHYYRKGDISRMLAKRKTPKKEQSIFINLQIAPKIQTKHNNS